MQDEWVNPTFEEIAVCGECTAYSGVEIEIEDGLKNCPTTIVTDFWVVEVSVEASSDPGN